MKSDFHSQLHGFASSHGFLANKGRICVALVITRAAIANGLPLDPANFLTTSRGQVAGLSSAAVQAILKDYGIVKVLVAEGGRTSRGSVGSMREYVAFLNMLARGHDLDLREVEAWWVERVRDCIVSSSIKFKVVSTASIKAGISGVLEEARKRQIANYGTGVIGPVMLHLVGAKLEILFPDRKIHHGGYHVVDAPSGRSGKFEIGDSVIHVTANPTDRLVRECAKDLARGRYPLILTRSAGIEVAEYLADDCGILGRVDVVDVTQFLVANTLELTCFESNRRRHHFEQLIARYNAIIAAHETDPRLMIELA